jgi:hypothetical protein
VTFLDEIGKDALTPLSPETKRARAASSWRHGRCSQVLRGLAAISRSWRLPPARSTTRRGRLQRRATDPSTFRRDGQVSCAFRGRGRLREAGMQRPLAVVSCWYACAASGDAEWMRSTDAKDICRSASLNIDRFRRPEERADARQVGRHPPLPRQPRAGSKRGQATFDDVLQRGWYGSGSSSRPDGSGRGLDRSQGEERAAARGVVEALQDRPRE